MKDLLWQIDRLKTEKSILSGIKYFKDKYGVVADCVWVHPTLITEFIIPGVDIRYKASGSPLTVLIGVKTK